MAQRLRARGTFQVPRRRRGGCARRATGVDGDAWSRSTRTPIAASSAARSVEPVVDDDESGSGFRFVGACWPTLELDQVDFVRVSSSRSFRPPCRDVEVRIALPDLAVVLGVQCPADLQRTPRRGITSLELHVPARSRPAADAMTATLPRPGRRHTTDVAASRDESSTTRSGCLRRENRNSSASAMVCSRGRRTRDLLGVADSVLYGLRRADDVGVRDVLVGPAAEHARAAANPFDEFIHVVLVDTDKTGHQRHGSSPLKQLRSDARPVPRANSKRTTARPRRVRIERGRFPGPRQRSRCRSARGATSLRYPRAAARGHERLVEAAGRRALADLPVRPRSPTHFTSASGICVALKRPCRTQVGGPPTRSAARPHVRLRDPTDELLPA